VRVALVHDWLTGTRGGEKVLLELVRMFPSAPVFTLFHFPGSQPPEIEAAEIRTTFLQKLVSPYADYRKLLPLFFMAAETWDLSEFDLVISSSHCVAKNAKKAPGAFHLCYCHTPVRYLNDQFDDYFRGRPAFVTAAARLARGALRARNASGAGHGCPGGRAAQAPGRALCGGGAGGPLRHGHRLVSAGGDEGGPGGPLGVGGGRGGGRGLRQVPARGCGLRGRAPRAQRLELVVLAHAADDDPVLLDHDLHGAVPGPVLGVDGVLLDRRVEPQSVALLAVVERRLERV